ncbi:hypothetical protein ANCCAN_24450 [Ancylostoma caninum]|uniref:Uncharacterized protein n=1 Tax=Ancylostoma caninum TaxID=29170 RepID=A0A368FFJ5_ANCCA|nr:hypothetical protein ANCCAN_24450 [Ancylostoma caninum]
MAVIVFVQKAKLSKRKKPSKRISKRKRKTTKKKKTKSAEIVSVQSKEMSKEGSKEKQSAETDDAPEKLARQVNYDRTQEEDELPVEPGGPSKEKAVKVVPLTQMPKVPWDNYEPSQKQYSWRVYRSKGQLSPLPKELVQSIRDWKPPPVSELTPKERELANLRTQDEVGLLNCKSRVIKNVNRRLLKEIDISAKSETLGGGDGEEEVEPPLLPLVSFFVIQLADYEEGTVILVIFTWKLTPASVDRSQRQLLRDVDIKEEPHKKEKTQSQSKGRNLSSESELIIEGVPPPKESASQGNSEIERAVQPQPP